MGLLHGSFGRMGRLMVGPPFLHSKLSQSATHGTKPRYGGTSLRLAIHPSLGFYRIGLILQYVPAMNEGKVLFLYISKISC
jgi:hypothetical protein